MTLNRDRIEDFDPDIVLADGMEEAFIGISCGHHHRPAAVYSYEKAMGILMGRGMSAEEAEEWMSFNVLSAYVGEYTPIWVGAVP